MDLTDLKRTLARCALRLVLGRRLPIVRGTLRVPGIEGPVSIRRDRWGIPCIEASSEVDAFFGLGFCHGQDRTFQLELQLRASRGTLAAILGDDALPFDRLARRIGFHRATIRQVEAMDPELRAVADAYAAGATRGAREGSSRVAHEFAMLRTGPTEYTAADVRGALNLMSFALASNWDMELTRLRVLESDGPEALRALDPSYPADHPVASPPGAKAGDTAGATAGEKAEAAAGDRAGAEPDDKAGAREYAAASPAAERLSADIEGLRGVVKLGGASNNWAIAPSRTREGRPLLANDPHLPPGIPSPWYLARIRTPGWSVAGASFVGGPGFAVGHNEHGAWGLTAGLIDNTDLFVEEVGADGRSVLEGDGVVPCEVIEERIEVRGGNPVVESILVTPRGPIVGPALGVERHAISLRAVWLDALPLEGFLRAHRTRSLEEFHRTFRRWPAMSASMVYAHVDGTIGWLLGGRAPRRKKGSGLLPAPGRDVAAGWLDEPVPFEEMPFLENPACGFVASANTKPVPEGEGPYLGGDWIDGYRLSRIHEALAARDDWDVAGCAALQMDSVSLPWREIRDAVLAAPPASDEARRGIEILRGWDGEVGPRSAGASVYELFIVEMVRRTVEAKAPRSAAWMLGKGPSPLAHRSMLSVRRVAHLARLIRRQPAGWLDRPWPEAIAEAVAEAVRSLERARGSDPSAWAWGRLRRLEIPHPLGVRPVLRAIFSLGPIEVGGDSNTVAQMAVDPFDPTAGPLFTPSLRAVIDVGNWSASRFSLPGGQSGNPLSPHYADQLPLWSRGEGVSLAWIPAGPEDARDATPETLRLEPAP